MYVCMYVCMHVCYTRAIELAAAGSVRKAKQWLLFSQTVAGSMQSTKSDSQQLTWVGTIQELLMSLK